ncbi:MAG: hypothetical protein ABL957_07265 [Parvularculaceae bacterium]
MLKQAIWAFAGAGALGLVLTAAAQPDNTAAKERAASADDAPVIVPRKSRVPSIAAAAASGPVKSAGSVDWDAVKEEVDEAKASDAEFQRQVRAMELTRPLSESEKQKMRPKGLRTAAPQQFKRVTSGEVRETRVPVLVPMLPDMMGAMKVAARENAFSAFGDMPDGDYVEVIGTRMRVVGGTSETMSMRRQARAAAMPELAALSAPYEISHHEQGVDLSFSRFNVAYQISVYCKDPDGDAHCSGDEYVVSLADSLAILNPEEGAAP